MVRVFAAFIAALFISFTGPSAQAQEPYWVQIEANSSLTASEAAARRYSSAMANVVGFRLSSGWYAIAAGPFTEQDAYAELSRLSRLGLLPRDAYVEGNDRYGPQFWPVGDDALARFVPGAQPGSPTLSTGPVVEVTTELPDIGADPAAQAITTTEIAAQTETAVVEAVPPTPVVEAPREETRREALQSERLLDRPQREALQIALQWFGFYRSGIDGAFGPGTRNSMAAWQAEQGVEQTGVLTTTQRAQLLQSYDDQLASVGLAVVRNDEAGIEMQLPTARVALSRVEAPFVHYDNTDGSDTRVVLISQAGNRATLHGLYDVMQTLELIPLEGERSKRNNDFTITGQDADIHSYTYARLQDGTVKGFTMTWKPSEAALMSKIAEIMKASLRSTGGNALPDTAGQENEQRIDLLAGLEIRQPVRSRSGFYIDARGTVLTTVEAVDQCARVTLAGVYDADVVSRDDAAGFAVLRSRTALAPISYAQFMSEPPRLRADIAVAGFSFQGALGAPTLSFGSLEDLRGLGGEENLARLSVDVRDGDTGGPVFGASGAVIGMLLPRADNNNQRLPEGVNFALKGSALTDGLRSAGVGTQTAPAGAALDPVDLTRIAGDMTALVSCWQ